MEIHTQRYIAFQRAIAVLVAEEAAPEVILDPEQWLNFAGPDRDVTAHDVWPMFRAWAPARLAEAEAAVAAAVQELAASFAWRHAASIAHDRANLDRWLARRADAICGPRQPEPADLFGMAPSGPAWRRASDPLERLTSFATDIANPAADRRAADGVVSVHRRRVRNIPTLAPPVLHPIGMLMLVPAP
jgi:hypothetical protein